MTRPISTSRPIALISSNDRPNSLSPRNPPMKDSGADSMIVNGWSVELNSEARIM